MAVLENCLEIDRASCSARNIRRWEKKSGRTIFIIYHTEQSIAIGEEKMIYSMRNLSENLRFGEHFRQD